MGEDEELVRSGTRPEEPLNEGEDKPDPGPTPPENEDASDLDQDGGAEDLGPGLWRAEDDGATLSDAVLISRLESLIFVSPEPISVRRLARILSVEGKRIRALLGSLSEHYADRGIVLKEVSGGFQFRSHPDNALVVRNVFKLKPLKLSRAALEALAIVAYRQPLTRAEVEAIRGVDSGGVLKFLFEKGLVRVFGRKEEPGRPIIYGTSQAFLELFGLKSLADLPALHEFSELWDEHRELIDAEDSDEPNAGENAFAIRNSDDELSDPSPGSKREFAEDAIHRDGEQPDRIESTQPLADRSPLPGAADEQEENEALETEPPEDLNQEEDS